MTGLILGEITYFILFYFCAGQHTTLLVFRTNTCVDWGSVGGGKVTALNQDSEPAHSRRGIYLSDKMDRIWGVTESRIEKEEAVIDGSKAFPVSDPVDGQSTHGTTKGRRGSL